MELDNKKMSLITGGTVGSAIINAVSNLLSLFYDMGRELGSGLRRIIEGKNCPIN